jgi:hypothetical protein
MKMPFDSTRAVDEFVCPKFSSWVENRTLGHASTSVTQAIYQHARPEATAEAARAIANALLGEQ